MAFSGLSLMRLRMTLTNCPTVRSAGTRYFFLSMSGMSLFSAFSTMTGILSWYFSRMRAASAWRFSAGVGRTAWAAQGREGAREGGTEGGAEEEGGGASLHPAVLPHP